jgi:hypothetical protein
MQSSRLRRRDFISLIGGAAACSVAARAQERVRRVGVLSNPGADDAEMQSRTAAFAQGLRDLGWTVGQNLQIDYRWSNGSAERLRATRQNWSRLSQTWCWPPPASQSCRSWR